MTWYLVGFAVFVVSMYYMFRWLTAMAVFAYS